MKLARAWPVVLALVLARTAAAQIPGPSNDYNVFIFGTGTFTGLDDETIGNLAAGGAVTLTSYSIATGIEGNGSTSMSSPDPARLVVGGALTTNNGGEVGDNGTGTIYYGTIAPTYNNGGFTSGTTPVPNQTLVNFAASQTYYTNYSQQLGALSGTNLTLSGSTSLDLSGLQSGLNVVNIQDGSTGLNLSSIEINGATNATVLINILGSGPVTFMYLGQSGSLDSGADVLFNFVTATSVNVEGTLSASILAPYAGVTAENGDINGQLIADSFSGSEEFTNVAFAGTLPAPVPLPGSVLLFVSGLLGAAVILRRRPATLSG